jgi:broad specificity polyphosphatase/5'/3'-nucleotidase SurE
MHLIAITNDDGIGSPGLRTAVEAVLPLGSVIIVAPSRQQTSTGRSFRGDKNAFLQPVEFPVNGTEVRAYSGNRIADPTSTSKIGDAVCHYAYDKATLEPDSDILALCNGLVSVTPVSMDLTSRVDLKSFLRGVKPEAQS